MLAERNSSRRTRCILKSCSLVRITAQSSSARRSTSISSVRSRCEILTVSSLRSSIRSLTAT